MTQDTIFSGPIRIQITDYATLRPVQTSDAGSVYEPVGFDGAVTVSDRRQQPREVAWLTVTMTETAVLSLTLTDTDSHAPTHALWLATGPRETVTPHNPLFMQIAPLDDDQYAYLALTRLSRRSRQLLAGHAAPAPL